MAPAHQDTACFNLKLESTHMGGTRGSKLTDVPMNSGVEVMIALFLKKRLSSTSNNTLRPSHFSRLVNGSSNGLIHRDEYTAKPSAVQSQASEANPRGTYPLQTSAN